MNNPLNHYRTKTPTFLKSIFTLLGILILVGCSYDFSKDNYTDLQEPDLNNNTINLNSFTNLDTVNIQTNFNYRFEKEATQAVMKAEVFLDGQRITSNFSQETGTFTIDPSRYEDGQHTIRIEQTFNAGTGSIADQTQVEVYKASKEFLFIINRKPSPPPAINAAIIQEGTIYLEWDAPSSTTYKNAYVSLQFKRREIKIPLTPEIIASGIYNDTQTVLFVGNSNGLNYDDFESVTYSIVFESEYTELYSDSQTLTYDPSLFQMKLSFKDFNTHSLKWTAHPMYGNFEEYELNSIVGPFLGDSQGGEYLVNEPYIFGKDYTTGGSPKESFLFLPYYSFRELALDEETFGLLNLDRYFLKDIIYNPSNTSYNLLVVEQSAQSNAAMHIYEFSEGMEFIKKTFIANYDSPRDEYLKLYLDPLTNNFYLDARSSSYYIDKSDLSIIDQYSFTSTETSLRNNILKSWQYSNDQLTITNKTTNAVIYSGQTVNSGHLSRCGKYVFIKTETEEAIYSITNDVLVKVLDINASSNVYHRNVHIEDDILFYADGNEVFIVDLITLSNKSFTFGTYVPTLQYDPIAKKLLLSQNGYNGIYDMQTEEVILFGSETFKRASGYYRNADRDYRMHLQNGRLIHSKGIYIDLE